jgi:uncharacterized protein
MRAISPIFFIIIFGFIAVVDSYTFRGVRLLSFELASWVRILIYSIYWLVPIIIAVTLLYVTVHLRTVLTTNMFHWFYFLTGFFILLYVPKLVFIPCQLSSDLFRLIGFVISKLSPDGSKIGQISASMAHTIILTKVGVVAAAIPFVTLLYGMMFGRFNYQVNKQTLYFDTLPKAFDGFRVLQVSDWHIGSFNGHTNKVKESINLINNQNADIILFTGDLVNNVAEEAKEFIPLLQKLHAPNGVYSILGNHDYGEYVRWDRVEDHEKNMEDLFRYEADAGWKLLRNESVVIEREGDTIGLAGVENWGLPPFPQYGDLNKALEKIRSLHFKILMSHDPTHWDAEVRPKSDVDLTLSGHTHAMQFGINIPGFKWSPIKWRYPRWAGLYREGKQYLYVNVGIGYIGFPGRVGFLPEISVFELKRKI